MDFHKNVNLEGALALLNTSLEGAEAALEAAVVEQKVHPTLLKLGCSRSGGTLFSQWCRATDLCAVPTNFISRFYKAPAVGALISEIVTHPKYSYRNEFSDVASGHGFSSDLGKTQGFNAPHDFWYFWRNHFDFPDVPATDAEFESSGRFESFNRRLIAMQAIFGKPLLLKGHLVNPYVEVINRRVENCLFVHVRRDLVAVVKSILAARVRWHGSIESWFSFKPREWSEIEALDPYEQVAGQVYFIEREILAKRERLGSRYISLWYEDLCEGPAEAYRRLLDRVNELSAEPLELPYSGPAAFAASSGSREIDEGRVRAALDRFSSTYGCLSVRSSTDN